MVVRREAVDWVVVVGIDGGVEAEVGYLVLIVRVVGFEGVGAGCCLLVDDDISIYC